MTLFLYTCYTDEFVIVTADTRYCTIELHPITLEKLDDTHTKIGEDRFNKAEFLTDNVIMFSGGLTTIGDEWDEYMRANVKPHYFMNDCYEVFKESILYLAEKHSGEPFWDKYLNSQYTGLNLAGFNKDGRTSLISRSSNNNYQPYEIIMDGETELQSMFAPNEDLYDHKDELLDYTKRVEAGKYILTSELDIIKQHYKYVQSLIASQFPLSVTTTMMVCILERKKNGKIRQIHLQGDVNDENFCVPFVKKYRPPGMKKKPRHKKKRK